MTVAEPNFTANVEAPALSLAELTVPALRRIANERGHDAAMQRVYEAVLASPIHRPWIDRINAARAAGSSPAAADITLAIVPGALYREYPETGADGKRFADIVGKLGFATELIPIKSLGNLEENARIIAGHLRARPPGKTILVSFSKGGADVKTALALPDTRPAFDRITTWISVGGILNGTPLVTWLRQHPIRQFFVKCFFRFKRLNFRVAASLDHGPGAPLAAPLRLPPHLRLFHLIAFPRAAELSIPIARRAYERLCPFGPNDAGGLLLGDLAGFPGHIYPIAKADHFLRTPDIPEILRAVLAVATDESR